MSKTERDGFEHIERRDTEQQQPIATRAVLESVRALDLYAVVAIRYVDAADRKRLQFSLGNLRKRSRGKEIRVLDVPGTKTLVVVRVR